jgi:6,7-dimethyl-8-ribityllumazine synthase
LASAALPRIRRKGRRRFWRSGRRNSRASNGNSPPRRRVTERTTKEKIKIELPLEPAVAAIEGGLSADGKRFAIVVSRFNAFITERLFQSAYDGLLRSGAKKKDISLVRVPGAFEIPLAARTLAETGRYDAIVCLGCLIRGDTAHYDVIVNEVTRGIGQSAQETGVPHAFGVLTCDTLEQAIDRAGLKMGNKGFEAALAAVEMVNLKTAVSRQPSAVRKGKAKPTSRKR